MVKGLPYPFPAARLFGQAYSCADSSCVRPESAWYMYTAHPLVGAPRQGFLTLHAYMLDRNAPGLDTLLTR